MFIKTCFKILWYMPKIFETIETIEDFDIGLYGIIETEEGDVVWNRFKLWPVNHLFGENLCTWKVFLRFYKHHKIFG